MKITRIIFISESTSIVHNHVSSFIISKIDWSAFQLAKKDSEIVAKGDLIPFDENIGL